MERLKIKADYFLDNNIKAFIKDNYDTYYFCDILLVGEIYLTIYDFKRKEKFRLMIIDLKDIKEYIEGES